MDKVLEIVETIMKKCLLSCPTSFNAPIIKEVKTKQLMKKHVGGGAMQVYHINIIYSRIIELQVSKSTFSDSCM